MTEEIIINDITINIDKDDMETCLSRLLGEAAAGMFWRYAWARDAYDNRLYARIKDLKSQLANATKPVEAPTAPATPTAPECPFQVGDWVRRRCDGPHEGVALVFEVSTEHFVRTLQCESAREFLRYTPCKSLEQSFFWPQFVKEPVPFWASDPEIQAKIAELLGNAAPVEEVSE